MDVKYDVTGKVYLQLMTTGALHTEVPTLAFYSKSNEMVIYLADPLNNNYAPKIREDCAYYFSVSSSSWCFFRYPEGKTEPSF